MNANHRMDVEDEETEIILKAATERTLSETVYVGRASFRMACQGEVDLAAPQPVDVPPWFRQNRSRPGGAGAGRVNRGEPFGRPDDGTTDTGAKRGWRWVKPSWIVVGVPVIAFVLGMFVAPLAGSSLPKRLERQLESRKDRLAAGARAGQPLFRDLPSPARPAPVVTPIVASAPPEPPLPVVSLRSIPRQGRAEGHPFRKVATARGSVARGGSPARVPAADANTLPRERHPPGADEAKADAQPSVPPRPGTKPWIDPWAG